MEIVQAMIQGKHTIRFCILFVFFIYSQQIFALLPQQIQTPINVGQNILSTSLLDQYFEMKKNDPKAARTILPTLVVSNPNNVMLQKEMGYQLLTEKKLQEALPYFEAAARLNPSDYTIQMQIGYILNDLGKKPEALTYFKKSSAAPELKIREESLKMIQSLSQTTIVTENPQVTLFDEYYRVKKENPASARKLLAELLVKYPNNINAQQEMGYQLLNEKKLQAALPYFVAAARLNPDDANIQLQIGYILNDLGKTQEALDYFTRASSSPNLKIKTQSEEMIQNLSQKNIVTENPQITPLDEYYRVKKENLAAAREILIDLLAKDPDNIVAQKEMGYQLLNEKKLQASLPYFTAAAKLKPDDANIQMQIGYILNDLGKKSEALNYFKNASSSPDLKIREQSLKMIQGLSQPNSVSQSPQSILLDEYYKLKKEIPAAARKILANLLVKYPDNIVAQKEMGYLFLNEKNNEQALLYFKNALKISPNDNALQMQIAYILVTLKKPQEALSFFQKASTSADPKIRLESLKAIKNIQNSEKTTQKPGVLDEYYKLKKNNPEAAQAYLANFLAKNPCNLDAQKEMGYLLVKQKRPAEAVEHFLVAQQLKPADFEIAMQIAYLHDELQNSWGAYDQFHYATHSCDYKIRSKAHQAMINISGKLTKLFPDPFFADLYFDPNLQYRFRDYIYPAQFRFGVTYGKHKQGELYGIVYFTRDTRSGAGISPAIYADNTVIYSAGTRYRPINKIPVHLYIEVGRAYYIINQHKGPWESDIRLGAAGYKRWGADPSYAECLISPMRQIGNVYGNFSYYSRFDHNWIGQLKAREGVRIAQYKYSSLDVYLRSQYLWDSKHYFYNNTFEIGPGIAIVPDNRINLVIRGEWIRGYYLPVNSPDQNPYGKTYNGSMAEVDTYIRF